MIDMIDIFVPTYGKSEIPILKFLDDPNIRLNFCIRSDCDKSIYDDIKKLDRVNFIELGYGIDNLGETRKRIVQYCIDNNISRCFMFDDGITFVGEKRDYRRRVRYAYVLQVVQHQFDLIKSMYNKLPICCYTFCREGNKFLGVDCYDEFFCSLPLQAVLLDIDMLKKYDVNYEDMKICGLEDVAFFMDCVKKGLVFYGEQDVVIDGKLPNVIVKGGSHEDTDIRRFVRKRDKDHKLLMKYVGPTYGIMLTKKWRQSLGFSLTYARIDFGYFRDVLVDNRSKNRHLIKTGFRIE